MIVKIRIILCLLLLLATSFNTGPLFAHDMWLQPTNNGYVVVLGHADKVDPYDPDRVVDVTGYTVNGWPVPLAIDRGKDKCSVTIDEGFCALTAIFDNKYWLKTTEGWKNQRNKEGLDILQEGRSYKYTKHIIKWCDFLNKPLGQRVEIIPLKDPTSLQEGDLLPVQILFEGKPTLEARLSKSSTMNDSHALERVQGKGPFTVRIGPPGLQLIKAKILVPVKHRRVVWFAVSLTFWTTMKKHSVKGRFPF